MTSDLDIGYHVIDEDALDDYGVFDEEMSIVEFLRRLKRREEIPHDMTVRGLDDYLLGVDDAEEACDYIHRLLRDRVNYLNLRNPRVQFVVDDVENWSGPVIPTGNKPIKLNRIFHGSMEQSGPGWYSSNLNVQS